MLFPLRLIEYWEAPLLYRVVPVIAQCCIAHAPVSHAARPTVHNNHMTFMQGKE